MTIWNTQRLSPDTCGCTLYEAVEADWDEDGNPIDFSGREKQIRFVTAQEAEQINIERRNNKFWRERTTDIAIAPVKYCKRHESLKDSAERYSSIKNENRQKNLVFKKMAVAIYGEDRTADKDAELLPSYKWNIDEDTGLLTVSFEDLPVQMTKGNIELILTEFSGKIVIDTVTVKSAILPPFTPTSITNPKKK